MLDYGCGSGILAIGAALHGAKAIDAVDIDSAAVESTRANAQANGVALNAALPHAAQGAYDLVLANILAKPLTLLAPLLTAHLAGGASLVLAGILERQADELRAAYAPWCALDVADSEDGWVLMTGRRRRAARMSLATRCSACSTVFRVQQDQLKASEGWVRCGRCGTVFSALEGLFDLERESNSGRCRSEQPRGAAPKPSRRSRWRRRRLTSTRSPTTHDDGRRRRCDARR